MKWFKKILHNWFGHPALRVTNPYIGPKDEDDNFVGRDYRVDATDDYKGSTKAHYKKQLAYDTPIAKKDPLISGPDDWVR